MLMRLMKVPFPTMASTMTRRSLSKSWLLVAFATADTITWRTTLAYVLGDIEHWMRASSTRKLRISFSTWLNFLGLPLCSFNMARTRRALGAPSAPETPGVCVRVDRGASCCDFDPRVLPDLPDLAFTRALGGGVGVVSLAAPTSIFPSPTPEAAAASAPMAPSPSSDCAALTHVLPLAKDRPRDAGAGGDARANDCAAAPAVAREELE
mmetsp:Transcript_8940/g.21976  ORF Transcript_8940/g.21976 Transcript_8940/m.21976 type:complete len:209 (+) Transcript_8940:292-918(+)